MSENAERLLESVLRLAEPDRAELSARLIESLEPTVDDDVTPLWQAEIDRRAAELDRGSIKGVPWPVALREIMTDRN